MAVRHILVIGFLAAILTPSQQMQNEEFHEELYVNPLPNGFVNTYFQFTTRWHYGERSNLHHTRLIPRPIAETLLQYDVKELHIRLTQGLWRYETWGYPVVDAGMGAEAWAWFGGVNLTSDSVDEQWIKLASTFSGILCASLNFIDKTNSVEPRYCFRPQFYDGNQGETKKFVRYASLPREIVCTENLTPWKKLLPCNSKEGFASLLNSGFVHNTNYHSLGIKVRTICEKPDHNCILEFTESVNLVYDTRLLGNGDFSLRRLFGQGLNGYCPLAGSSKIYVNMNEAHRYDITPEPANVTTSTRGGATTIYGIYDMQGRREERLFNIAWLQRKSATTAVVPLAPPPPPIHAHRFILGRGQERGYIVTEVTNNHYAALTVGMQEHIPWFVPIYMHTLRFSVLGSDGSVRDIKPMRVHYIPGVQRERPYHLELAFELPAKSTVRVTFDFDYFFLKWLEYPPDANHGHYLGSAVLFTMLPVARNYSAIPIEGYLFADSFNATRTSYFLDLHTEALLLSLPTPDFSMPYNVICLACTVVALAFGPIHSVATKRIVIEQRDGGAQSLLTKLKNNLLRRKDVPVTSATETTIIEEEEEAVNDIVGNEELIRGDDTN